MRVNEIFYSIQGESSHQGYPCVFIRLQGCNLRCSWCDTKYAQDMDGGKEMEISEVINKVKAYNCNYVCITGGEPLLQKEEVKKLIKGLNRNGIYNISIETNGSIVRNVDADNMYDAWYVIDVKLPSSGMYSKMNLKNIQSLMLGDEYKFVIADKDDYEIAKRLAKQIYAKNKDTHILFSVVYNKLSLGTLANWILEDKLNYVQLQIQLHKVIKMK